MKPRRLIRHYYRHRHSGRTVGYDAATLALFKELAGMPELVRHDVLHQQLIAASRMHGYPYPQREHDAARRAWEALELALTIKMRV